MAESVVSDGMVLAELEAYKLIDENAGKLIQFSSVY